MFETNGKYGNVNINGRNIDIEKTKVNDLNEYLKDLEEKREKLIDQQNDYLSQIIK